MLAEMLAHIAETKSSELFEDFKESVQNHPDKELLLQCARSANRGEKGLCYGRSLIIPENLEKEGFFVSQVGSGFYLNWAWAQSGCCDFASATFYFENDKKIARNTQNFTKKEIYGIINISKIINYYRRRYERIYWKQRRTFYK